MNTTVDLAGLQAPRTALAPGPIMASRDQLTAWIRAAGLPMIDYPTTRFAAPALMAQPGEPFLATARVGGRRRMVRWGLLVVAGAYSNPAAYDALARLVEGAITAVELLPSWAAMGCTGPRVATIGGQPYLAAVLTTETLVALDPTYPSS